MSISVACPWKPSHRLVDHDTRIRQRVTFAFGAGGQEQRSHACGLSQADRIDRGFDILHGVINAQVQP